MTEHRPAAAAKPKPAAEETVIPAAASMLDRPATDAALASLLGVHLAEVETLLDAWGTELRRSIGAGQPGPVPVVISGPAVASAVTADTVAAPVVTPQPAVKRPELVLSPWANFDFTSGWEGWSHHASASMQKGGVVQLKQSQGTPGISSSQLPAPQERLLCLRISIDVPAGANSPEPALRVTNEAGDPLGPDFPCASGTSEHFIFVPTRTTKLRYFVISLKPKEGLSFTVRKLEALTVDIDSFQAQTRHDLGAPVVAAMASMPQRRPMMADAVASLLLQCDRVRVFLNGYPEVPEFLDHPRVDIRRSQDWDDKGDAGKFGWIDVADEPGYRVVVDDDLVFPPDFVRQSVATLRRYQDHAFVGLHGVLLRQPVTGYYDPASRYTFHFESAVQRDRTVHVLGTGALCYHSSKLDLRWDDFAHRNMADMFVAVYAQQHGIPMVTFPRARNWVRQNKQEGGFDTIYDHSLKSTRSHFDSSLIQDALVKHAWPVTIQPTMRPKIVFCLLVASLDSANEAIEAWRAAAWTDFDWVIILCQITQDAALSAWLETLRLPHEMHLLNQLHESPKARLAAAIDLAVKLKGHLFCLAQCELRIVNGRWINPVMGVLKKHQSMVMFAHRGEGRFLKLGLEAVAADGRLPLLCLTLADVAAVAGDVDLRQPDVMTALGEWVARLSLVQSLPAIRNPPRLPDVTEALHSAVEHELPIVQTYPLEDLQSKVGWRHVAASPQTGRVVNDVFERVCVINLDRRSDRWNAMRRRLDRAGIRAERVQAVDGQAPDVKAEFAAYESLPQVTVPEAVRGIDSSWKFYRDYDSQISRVAYEEARTKRKAIASAGAWAYLMSWQNILERALEDQVKTLLVFDDDVAFHRNVNDVFAAAHRELPADWLILQLGTLQYDWRSEAITRVGRHLYRTNGSAIGSHAVGLRFEMIPYLLELVKRRDMPFDVGPLSAATRAYQERCFVVWPNAAIQVLHDSDIGTSEFQKSRSLEIVARTYRWHLPDFDL